MGQGHQLFVIARPAPAQRYRSFAVVHNQWLYGVSAINTCLRLVRLFSDKTNRIGLKQELAFARDYYAKDGAKDLEATWQSLARNGPVPFPFIAAGLVFGAASNPETGYARYVHLENMGRKYNEGDNNNGITVIDITDLDNVRYCFVDYHGMESSRPVPLHKPLSAWEYVQAYYEDLEPKMRAIRHTAEALEAYGLIEIEALADCWPDKAWGVKSEDADRFIRERGGRTANADTVMQSLRDKATRKFLELLGDSNPDPGLLDLPMSLPGVGKVALSYCVEHVAEVAKSPAGAAILQQAFAGEKYVNLSPFPDLPPASIRTILGSEHLRQAEVLNLSGTQAFADGNTVATICAIGPNVTEIYDLVRPDREDDDGSVMEAILSGALKSIRIPEKVILGSAFSKDLRNVRQRGEKPPRQEVAAPEPHADSGPLSASWPTPGFPVEQVLLKVELKTDEIEPRSTVDEPVKVIQLGDGLLGPARFASGLLYLFSARLSNPYHIYANFTAFEASLTFATAPSLPARLGAACSELGQAPSDALGIGIRSEHTFRWGSRGEPLRPLGPDRWAAVARLTGESKMEEVPGEEGVTENETREVTVRVCFEAALFRARDAAVTPRVVLEDGKKPKWEVEPEDLEVIDLIEFVRKYAPSAVDRLMKCIKDLEDKGRKSLVRLRAGMNTHDPPADDSVSFKPLSLDEVVTLIKKCPARMADEDGGRG